MRRLAALADRPHHQRLAAPHVAAGEHLRIGAAVGVGVGPDIAARIELEPEPAPTRTSTPQPQQWSPQPPAAAAPRPKAQPQPGEAKQPTQPRRTPRANNDVAPRPPLAVGQSGGFWR